MSCFEKFHMIDTKTPVLKPLSDKITDLQPATLLKK